MRKILGSMRLFDIDLTQLRSPNFHSNMIVDRELIYDRYLDCINSGDLYSCPLCGSAESKREYLNWLKYSLYECGQCGAVSPNLDLLRLEKMGFHESEIIEEDVKREIISTYQYRKATFAKERESYLLELIPDFNGTIKNILDIGCGPGYFISHMTEKGFNAKGLEVNPFCIDFCQNQGLNVSEGSIEFEPDEAYGLITMFDVLEHLPDPVKFFSDARKKLSKNGYILAFTPNIHSLSIFLMGKEHNMLAPFNHLCFYDPNSINYLAKVSGFEIINIDFYGLDLIDYLGMKQANDGLPYFENLRPMVGPLQAIIDDKKLGNCMRVLLRKV